MKLLWWRRGYISCVFLATFIFIYSQFIRRGKLYWQYRFTTKDSMPPVLPKTVWNRATMKPSIDRDSPVQYVRSNLEIASLLQKHGKLLKYRLYDLRSVLSRNTTVPVRYDDRDGPMSLVNNAHRGRITHYFDGRLGNTLYQYSALYAASVRFSMQIVLSKHCLLAKVFKLNATLVDEKRPGKDWAPFIEWTPYDSRMEHLDWSRDIELIGSYRSAKYYKDVREQLKQEYRFIDLVEQTAYEYLQKVTRGLDWRKSVLIGVHIRRSDMIAAYKRMHKEPVYTQAYLRTAMLFMSRKFAKKTILFVVCSEDIAWAKAHVSAGGHRVVFSENHDAGVDFAILSKSNHTIITVGTFGRWAAYLSGGTTVFYKHQPRSKRDNYVNFLYPSAQWKALSGREKV